MTAYTTSSTARRLRRGLGALAALAALQSAACSSDDVLNVTDPDIINPGDVRSAAGANAVRTGALARFNTATSGDESLFLFGGLLADEWRSGDTFIQRDETDQRNIDITNGQITTAFRDVQRARLSAQQAIDLLREFAPQAPSWQIAEMYLVQAFAENLMAEHFCGSIPFSTIVDGVEQFGGPNTTVQALELALVHADSGLALVTDAGAAATKVRNALLVTRGRILLNLERPADAAAAVAEVPTDFEYLMQHSQTTNDNGIWALNNNARRYTVSAGEGGNGLDFVTVADPRVPTCEGGSDLCEANDISNAKVFDTQSTLPLYAQLIWPTRETSVAIITGVEARLVEAEAQLAAGDFVSALLTLNTLRARVDGLAPLVDAGSEAARLDQLFRERAFWLFSTGHRLGDLRRLIRQYDRTPDTVFPVGEFNKGGVYGEMVNIPIPQSEENNEVWADAGGRAQCVPTDA